MTADTIQDFLHASPFVPFTVHVADGKVFTVDHPDFAMLSRNKRVLIVNFEGDRTAWVDVMLVTGIEAATPEHA